MRKGDIQLGFPFTNFSGTSAELDALVEVPIGSQAWDEDLEKTVEYDGVSWNPIGDGTGGAVDSVNGQTGTVVLDAGDIPNTPAGNIAATDVQAALNELDSEKLPTSYLDTDGTLAANSDAKIASQKAVKTFVNNAVTGLLDFKGSTDCSANPNYPAASKGDAYVVSVAGKIGGASGKSVDVGDVYVASADNAGGTEASVGTSWFVLEHNLAGALLAANNLSDLVSASAARTNLGLGALAVLNSVSAADVGAIPIDGGIAIATTWTRTGNHTYTVPGDLTAYYRKDTKVRYKDGGSYEYGVIASSSHAAGTTTVNLIPNSDFAMAAVTITDTYLSYIVDPEGFPEWFNWTVVTSGLTLGTGGTITGKWNAQAQLIHYEVIITLGTSPTVGDVSFTPVVNSTFVTGSRNNRGSVTLLDTGTQNYYGVVLATAANSFNIRANTVSGSNVVNTVLSSTSPFTWGNTDAMFIDGWYPY